MNGNGLAGVWMKPFFLDGQGGGVLVVDKIDYDVPRSRLRSRPDCFSNNAVSRPSGKNII